MDTTVIKPQETTTFELPTPKFAKGQTVYYPAVESERVTDGCPDCLGAAKWQVKTPAGTEFEVPCPRCARFTPDIPAYYRTAFSAKAKSFLICGMKFGTDEWQPGGKYGAVVSYTAKGGGDMREGQLFASEAEALAAAEKNCVEKQKEHENRDDERERSTIAGYQIRGALAADIEKARRDVQYKYDALVDAIKELKEDYVSDLIFACKGGTDDTTVKLIIGRHLLEKVNEDAPEEWEGW